MNGSMQWGDLATLIGVGMAVGGVIWRVSAWMHSLRQELMAFKLKVAQDYVSVTSMRELEDRLISSIDRLGDRLDRLLTVRAHE